MLPLEIFQKDRTLVSFHTKLKQFIIFSKFKSPYHLPVTTLFLCMSLSLFMDLDFYIYTWQNIMHCRDKAEIKLCIVKKIKIHLFCNFFHLIPFVGVRHVKMNDNLKAVCFTVDSNHQLQKFLSFLPTSSIFWCEHYYSQFHIVALKSKTLLHLLWVSRVNYITCMKDSSKNDT